MASQNIEIYQIYMCTVIQLNNVCVKINNKQYMTRYIIEMENNNKLLNVSSFSMKLLLFISFCN